MITIEKLVIIIDGSIVIIRQLRVIIENQYLFIYN